MTQRIAAARLSPEAFRCTPAVATAGMPRAMSSRDMSITTIRSRLQPGEAQIAPSGAADVERPPDSVPWHARPRNRLIAGAALALIAVASTVVFWSGAEPVVPVERLRIATVTRGPFVSDVAASGLVVAANNPTLYSNAAGTVSVVVRAGDRVRRGDRLALVDSPQLANELAREQATLASLDAAIERQQLDITRRELAVQQGADLAGVQIVAARRELKRAESAWSARAISERDFERARDELQAAELNSRNALQNVSLERRSLAFDLKTRRLERDRQRLLVQNLQRRVQSLDVRSPVEGIVGNLLVQQRATVAENAPLLSVVDLSAFEVEFRVPESYAAQIALGMPVAISLAGRSLAGEVAGLSPEVRDGQVTGRARFTGKQPEGLRQNLRVAVRIVIDERTDVLKVERGAGLEDGARHAWRIDGDHAVRLPVSVGAVSVGEIEILSGLAVGDRIVVGGTTEFRDSLRVRIAD
jgi:HlyD family secretion protein